MTKEQIHKICKQYNIKNYTINDDMSIDVNGNVDLSYRNLSKLPLKFGKINEYFNCSDNKLTSLEGSPTSVGGNFNCYANQLTSLEGCPIEVGGNFSCSYNQLTSLEGCPIEVGRDFTCSKNELITLEGSPIKVGGYFYCSDNKLTTLENGPEFIGGYVYCYDNPIYEEFKTEFNSDYMLYKKYLRRVKIINNILNLTLS